METVFLLGLPKGAKWLLLGYHLNDVHIHPTLPEVNWAGETARIISSPSSPLTTIAI